MGWSRAHPCGGALGVPRPGPCGKPYRGHLQEITGAKFFGAEGNLDNVSGEVADEAGEGAHIQRNEARGENNKVQIGIKNSAARKRGAAGDSGGQPLTL